MPDQKTHDALPSTLKSRCNIAPPPATAELLNATQLMPTIIDPWEARFLVMYDAYMVQTGNLIDCDRQVGYIREWDDQHLEIKNEPRKTAN